MREITCAEGVAEGRIECVRVVMTRRKLRGRGAVDNPFSVKLL